MVQWLLWLEGCLCVCVCMLVCLSVFVCLGKLSLVVFRRISLWQKNKTKITYVVLFSINFVCATIINIITIIPYHYDHHYNSSTVSWSWIPRAKTKRRPSEEIRVKIEAKFERVVVWFIGNEFDQALRLLELALGGIVRQYLSANLCYFLLVLFLVCWLEGRGRADGLTF